MYICFILYFSTVQDKHLAHHIVLVISLKKNVNETISCIFTTITSISLHSNLHRHNVTQRAACSYLNSPSQGGIITVCHNSSSWLPSMNTYNIHTYSCGVAGWRLWLITSRVSHAGVHESAESHRKPAKWHWEAQTVKSLNTMWYCVTPLK